MHGHAREWRKVSEALRAAAAAGRRREDQKQAGGTERVRVCLRGRETKKLIRRHV